MLFYHFFYVALYSIYVLFTSGLPARDGKQHTPTILDWPGYSLLSAQVVSRPVQRATDDAVLDGLRRVSAPDVDRIQSVVARRDIYIRTFSPREARSCLRVSD